MTLKIRNKERYLKFRKFMIASTDLLKKIEAKEGLPRKQSRKYLVLKDGFTSRGESKIDFGLVTFTHRKEIDELPEFVDCAKQLIRNKMIVREMGIFTLKGHPGESADIPISRFWFKVLYLFLNRYLERNGQISFEENLFEELYAEFEKYVYKSKLPHMATAPLQGLSGNINEISFCKNLRLRLLSDSEKADYLQMQSPNAGASLKYDPKDFVTIADASYVLENTYSCVKGPQLQAYPYRKHFEDVLTALFLFKKGRLGFNIIKIEPILWNPFQPTSYTLLHGTATKPKVFHNSYELDAEEKQELLRFWKKFVSFRDAESCTSMKYIRLALRRFRSGIEENELEDRLIDLLIAFEALFLEDPVEMAYRLSNRVAMVLGKNDSEADEIRETISEAYKVRSKIVHGKEAPSIKIKGKVIELGDLVQATEEYLRQSLKTIISLTDNRGSQKEMLKLLDESLISADSRSKLREKIASAMSNIEVLIPLKTRN